MKQKVKDLIDKIVDTIPDIVTPEGKEKQDRLFAEAVALTTTKEEKKEAGQYLMMAMKERRNRKTYRPDIDTKEMMKELSPALSMAYIAKTYFGKDKSWLYQRLYNTDVNGKPASFTQDELKILADSIGDLSKRLSALSVAIHRCL